jgi:hypothetical protein
MHLTPQLKLTDPPVGLDATEVTRLQLHVRRRGAAPVARELGTSPTTLMRAIVGLPIRRATALRIRDAIRAATGGGAT